MTDKTEDKPRHKATYAKDKRKGGYLIRVAGPDAPLFSDAEVPVTLKSGKTHHEHLLDIVWAGNDRETGEPVALYTFEAKPREEKDVKF